MANLIRIKNLERETNLDNIVIPVDKASYLDNAKQISITGLTGYVLSGFTGSTINYSHPGTTTAIVGGIPVGIQITGMTITEIFNWMLYSGNPPTTTTTTQSTTTTTTTTLAPTTTTTTESPTTTTTTTPAPTTTTTTTQPPTTFQISNFSDDMQISSVKVSGIDIIVTSGSFPVTQFNSLIGKTYLTGSLTFDVYYTYTSAVQRLMFGGGLVPVIGNACEDVNGTNVWSTTINVVSNDNISVFAWNTNCPI